MYGAPERIRTSDPQIRNPMLCPAELPGRQLRMDNGKWLKGVGQIDLEIGR